MKILVTGAGGHVARLGIVGLREHDLRLAYHHLPGESDRLSADSHEIDLLDASDADLERLFEGIEVVVHSAYRQSGGGDLYNDDIPQVERFPIELANVHMTQRVYHRALLSGARRVVVISSNHAADWYEHALVHRRRRELVRPEDMPLSDNFYGWSKSSYELLGYPYACGTFGRRLEVVLLRIGSPYPIRPERFQEKSWVPTGGVVKPRGAAGFKRALGAFLSDRDCAQLFARSVEAQDIRDEFGVPWVIAYGISDNTRAFWSLQSARDVLGYVPMDDSEVLYADAVREMLAGETAGPGRLGL